MSSYTENTVSSTIFEQLHDMCQIIELIYDENGTVVDYVYQYVNPAFISFTGIAHAEIFESKVTHRLKTLDKSALKTYELVDKKEISTTFEHHIAELDKYFEVKCWKIEPQRIASIITEITEQKKATLAQQRRERQYITLAENHPDFLMRYDREYRHIYANQATLKSFGFKESELIGKTHRELGYPVELCQQWEEVIESIFQTGKIHSKTVGLKNLEEDLTIEWCCVPEFASDGTVETVLAISRDITDRVKMEESLKESESKFKALVTNNEEIIYIIDPNGIIQLSEGKGLETLGLKPGEVVGQSVFELYKDHSQIVSDLKKALNGETLTVEHKVGNTYFRSWYTPHKSTSGKIIGLLGLSVNITEQKKMEESLRASEELLKNTINLSPAIIAKANVKTGYFTEANTAITRILGYTITEFLSTPILEMIHPADVKDTKQEVKKQLNGEKIAFFENRYRCKDGSYKWLAWHGTVPDSNGTITAIGSDITESKKAQLQLLQSTELLEASQSIAQLGGWELDLVSGELFWTEETYRIHDTSPDTFSPTVDAGIHFYEGESRTKIAEAVEKAMKDGTGYDLELQVRTVKGRLIQVRTTCKVTVENGQPVKLTGIFQDITDRKVAENRLRESENRYKALYMEANRIREALEYTQKISHVGGWSVELQTMTSYLSDELIRIYELPPQTRLTVEEGISFYTPEDQTKISQAFETCSKEGKPYDLELQLITAQNNHRWVRTTGEPVYKNGEIVKLSGFIQDITTIKSAEQTLKRQIEFTDKVINSLADTFYLFNLKDGMGIRWNKALEKVSGYSSEYFKSHPPGNSYPPEELPRIEKVIEQALSKGSATVELSYIIKDGSRVPFEYSVVPITGPNGEAWMCAIGRDLSERKRAEEEKRNLEKSLLQSQKMEAIGTLAGGIAHDFNNILGVILGYTDITRHELPQDSELTENITKVFDSANRARDLVRQILAFSRQTKVEPTPLKVQPLLKECLKMMRSVIPTTIKIEQNIDDCCGYILSDPTQFNQIVVNLCTNAGHAMHQNGGTLTVDLFCSCKGKCNINTDQEKSGFIELAISDTGIGIAPEIIDKIFDPYFTTKELGQGTGMGLSIIHGIISSYGGEICVESEPGKGTTFHIYFPTVSNPKTTGQKIAEPTPKGHERILFVDDEELLAEVAKKMLVRLGYEVTTATSSLDAYDLFDETPEEFDLVITDMTMPEMTGLELSKHLLKKRPDIPIILCTGYTNLTDDKSAKAEGIKEFVVKPLTTDSLGKIIRKVLD